MPIWMLTALRFVRPLAPYIGIGVAVLAAWFLAVGHGKSVQKTKDQAQIASITRNRDTHAANEAKLQAALDSQNAAVVAMKSKSDQKAKDGAKALADAQKANKSLQDKAANLQRSAGLKYAKDAPCVVSDTLAQVGKI